MLIRRKRRKATPAPTRQRGILPLWALPPRSMRSSTRQRHRNGGDGHCRREDKERLAPDAAAVTTTTGRLGPDGVRPTCGIARLAAGGVRPTRGTARLAAGGVRRTRGTARLAAGGVRRTRSTA